MTMTEITNSSLLIKEGWQWVKHQWQYLAVIFFTFISICTLLCTYFVQNWVGLPQLPVGPITKSLDNNWYHFLTTMCGVH